MIKRILLIWAMCCLLWMPCVFASNWQLASSEADADSYIDIDNVRKSSMNMTYWNDFRWRSGDFAGEHMVCLSEADFSNEQVKVRPLQCTVFDKTGAPAEKSAVGDWVAVVPGSRGDKIIQFASQYGD